MVSYLDLLLELCIKEALDGTSNFLQVRAHHGLIKEVMMSGNGGTHTVNSFSLAFKETGV